MQLFFSGATSPGVPQPLASRSIGGFISSSLVPNGSIGNVFPLITKTSTTETRMIILQNTLGIPVEGITIWTITPDNALSTLLLAFVAPAYDTQCQRYYFEQLQTPESLPLQATVQSYEGEGEAGDIGTLAPGAYIGIWIVRSLTTPTTTTTTTLVPGYSDDSNCGCNEFDIVILEDEFKNGTISSDNIQLVINYTPTPPTTTTTTSTTTIAPTTTTTTTP